MKMCLKQSLLMMPAVAAAVMAFAAPPAMASPSCDHLVGFTRTYHFDRRQENGTHWNEANKGVGIEHCINENWVLGAGGFKNSYYKDTAYAGATWSPVHLGPVNIGITAAFASGYDKPFIGGLAVNTEYFGILVAPKAGGKNTSAFVSAQLRVPLDWLSRL